MDKQKEICRKSKFDPRYLETTKNGNVKLNVPPPDDLLPKNGEFMRNGKRYVRVVTRDYVRDIIIPEKGDTARNLILCKSELDKLEAVQETEGIDKCEELKKQREQYELEAAASDKRKRELKKHFVIYREMGPVLNKLEYVAKLKANLLLQKAKAVRQEDHDDIKLCNKLLLGTKCQAIRDAQIMERKQIKEELEQEERRLEEMMEQERLKKLAKEKEEFLFRQKKREDYINSLDEQVKRNLLEREMEAEKQLEEAMILNEAVMQSRIDYLKQEEEKKMKKEKIRKEINKMNEQVLNLLDEEKEKAKLADLKIQELMKKKAEEEQKREDELLREKREREKELAKMRKAQQLHSDDIEKREADRAKRIQEQYEEQWRKKERKEYEDKVKANEKLKEDRRLQVEEKQRAQARERERELEEVARLQMMEEEMRQKEKEQQEEKRRAKEEYKAQLLKQMNEREKERIASRRVIFADGVVEEMDLKLNQQSLKDNMKRKVAEIRTHKIPEKYIKDVEKKLRTKTNSGYD
ncbi:cilia- and flagella-associated protein 45 isoform X2 [Halyomorpha halys]|nr:cilia- and flagella-associated protein 45-like isoform X2 [Halyomorpha halys]XP_014291246.1 cilia- and flagella-associated protein 45-like isoform X2 [Halyomorpha halys]